jgi:uncharacterized protein (DUF1810 family)
MSIDSFNLLRFLSAQNRVYSDVFAELSRGRKLSHWMWFIFPQLKQLGRSSRSKFYGLSGLDEAKAYLSHPILGERLREVSQLVLQLPTNNPEEVLGEIDAVKLCSSMTLFDTISPNDVFAKVLDKYFNGDRDSLTLYEIVDATGIH